MNKQEFLDALWQNLSDLPQEDVARSLEYYEEMLDDCIEDGLTQDEAIAQIGAPSEVAERIRMELPIPTLVRARAKARRMKGWEIALLILGSPVWFPLVLSACIILLSLYIVLWTLLITLYVVVLAFACAFLLFLGLAIFTLYEQDVVHGIFLFGSSFLCGALAILLFLASKALTKALCRGTAAFVRKCKKHIIRKGSAA